MCDNFTGLLCVKTRAAQTNRELNWELQQTAMHKLHEQTERKKLCSFSITHSSVPQPQARSLRALGTFVTER